MGERKFIRANCFDRSVRRLILINFSSLSFNPRDGLRRCVRLRGF